MHSDLPVGAVEAPQRAPIRIPFNRAPGTGHEAAYVSAAIGNGHLSADGPFTRAASDTLSALTGVTSVLLVHSCTAALEMAARLLDLGPGDEVILPSYTFTSTANAVALTGATPVFVDVDPDTFNAQPDHFAAALTPRTRAFVPVHYAGISCDMQALMELAEPHGVRVVEDAAQGLMATTHGQALGSFGEMGALSFHETKNVTCGEGGALLLRDEEFVERAEILREKGTDRSRFFRGQVDKYTWVDIGSSHALSDLAAAFLLAQLEHAQEITAARLRVWDRYHAAFQHLEDAGVVRRPVIPKGSEHNAHMYYLLTTDLAERSALIRHLADRGIQAVFHYVPLDSAPAGLRYGRVHGDLVNTRVAGERLVRLPLWPALENDGVDEVIGAVDNFYTGPASG